MSDRTPAPQAVFLPHPVVPARGRMALYALDGGSPPRPSDAGLGDLEARPSVERLLLPGPTGPRVSDVEVAAIDLEHALGPLVALPARSDDALGVWSAAARLALQLVAARVLLPALVRAEPGVVARWRIDADDEVADAVARLAVALPPAGHPLARGEGRVVRPDTLLTAFLDAVADLAGRSGNPPPRPGRPRARLLPWTARWAEGLTDPDDPVVPLRDDADELVAGVAAWGGEVHAEELPGALELRLTAPDDQAGPWPLAFGVRTFDGAHVPAAAVWSTDDETVPSPLQRALLAGLSTAARSFSPLEPSLRHPAPDGVELTVDQAWELLTDAAPLLEADGVGVVAPAGLATSDLVVRLRVGGEAGAAHDGEPDDGERGDGDRGAAGPPLEPFGDFDDDQEPSDEQLLAAAGLPTSSASPRGGALAGGLTAFRWEVALGDEVLSPEDFAALVEATAPLVRFRDRWVRVDPGRVERLARLGPPGEMSVADALLLGLAGSERADGERVAGGPDGEDVEVVADGGIADLVQRVRAAGERPEVAATPDGFVGELRPYQRRGVAWLQAMGELGLGSVLADSMGLGKAIQLIAHLVLLGDSAGPHLVVCPTSVVGNWGREIARFAPGLSVTRHHGPDRPLLLDDVAGVVLTSYGTLRRDADILAAVEWDTVTLDEAQFVKNPATAAARAVRRLRARQRLALTGTPLENRLGELWALLDAVNPGLLGNRARFTRRFVTPIEQRGDTAAARRLRRLVAPFVLRREKTDPAVIADLPDKIERTVVAALTPEQAALYQSAVDRALRGSLQGATAMERRGRVLALLTELKQICNHPAQYLRERERRGRAELGGRSGKLALARELVAEARDSGAQVLVFTQYVGMGHLLVEQLGADLATEVPFLHGGVPAAARDRMVAAFQGETDAPAPPVLVVSLRAGGTGLNLTAATHVVHYDRWWNPAVEDQATDRAHRIGQSRAVEVHKLVTAGTVEERVAQVLERKRELAEAVVGAGEAWLTELGDSELAELVALAADAPIAEVDDDADLEAAV